MADLTPSATPPPTYGQTVTNSNYVVQAAGQGSQATINVNKTVQLTPRPPLDLAAAQRRLAEMAVDRVLPVGTLPPGSFVPFAPNGFFCGRDAELLRLAGMLKVGTGSGRVVAIVAGIGGVGKSQLAVEVAHRCGPYFAGGVYWISLADPGAVPALVAAACANMPDLPFGVPELELATQIGMIRDAWQSDLPRLLIFDNCEDEDLLEEWRPKSGGARVLVTTRQEEVDPMLGAEVVALETLAPDDSIALLEKLLAAGSATGARIAADAQQAGTLAAIAQELGDLPLALHMASSFLRVFQRTVTPAAYLEELRSQGVLEHQSLVEAVGRAPTPHELHVAKTFRTSYLRLETSAESDRLAVALLARAARFAPGQPIPRDLLAATLRHQDDSSAAPYTVEKAYRRLGKLGLLSTGKTGDPYLHRLLAQFVLGENANDDVQAAVEAAVLAEADQLNHAGDPRPLLAWQVHLRHVTGEALRRSDVKGAALANELGYHLNLAGDLAGAKPYYERSLAILEQVMGEQHLLTAQSLNNLGSLLQAMGDLSGARPYLERSLAIREQVQGNQHPDTAQSLNNLGGLLQAMGDLAGAKPYYEGSFAIWVRVLGNQHPDTATSLNNLGGLLHAMGDLAGAKSYLERSLAIREQVLGAQHPDTATSLNNLGSLLKDMGELSGAKPYFERSLAIKEQVLGEQHPDTAQSLNNLGSLMKAMGDYVGAKPYLERSLAILEQVLGNQHPTTALSLSNLGSLLYSMGDLSGARPYLERSLAIREQVLGNRHPDTALSLSNLGSLLHAMGDLSGAKPYLERSLAIREQVLGEQHPDTATSLNNLGGLLQAMGDLAGAKPYLERSLAIWEQVLGEMHPDTALSLNNLGGLLQVMGDLAGAKPYLERSLAIWEQVLGEMHPSTAMGLNNLGLLLYAMGDLSGAKPYFERSLAIFEQVLGEQHPYTATSLNNLNGLLQAMGAWQVPNS